MYSADDEKQCREFKDDYYECGRHTKENLRQSMLLKEWRRKCKANELPCSYDGLQDYVLAKERIAALNGLPSPYTAAAAAATTAKK